MKISENIPPFYVNLHLIIVYNNVDLVKEIRKPVEADLARFNEMFSESLRSSNPLLNLALEHLLQRKGKQMRPILVMLAARGAGECGEVLGAMSCMLPLPWNCFTQLRWYTMISSTRAIAVVVRRV